MSDEKQNVAMEDVVKDEMNTEVAQDTGRENEGRAHARWKSLFPQESMPLLRKQNQD